MKKKQEELLILCAQSAQVGANINKLKENAYVKRYIELCVEKKDLNHSIEELYKDIKMNELKTYDLKQDIII